MDGWVDFWKVVLYGAIGLFTVMSLWVIVAGAFDIRTMFASLRAGDENARDDEA